MLLLLVKVVFCNSCGAKYTQDRAESISSKLIRCTHRHIVFTIPEELRIFFLRDRSLLHVLFKACADTILTYFYKLNKAENFKPGFISTLHIFASLSVFVTNLLTATFILSYTISL